MLTSYSRVTVVTSQRSIDLALPSALPLADVLPQVMRYAAPDHVDGSPTKWTLAKLGGSSLSLSQTLGDAGVLDGDVLELRAQKDDVRPAMVEDVRDAVEDSVDAAGGVWTTRVTGSFAVIASAAVLSVLGLASATAHGFGKPHWLVDLAGPVSAVAATAALLFATWWAAQRTREGDAQIAAAAAVLWGALVGLTVAGELDLGRAVTVAITAGVAALVAGAARLLTPSATAHLAFAITLLGAGAVYAVVDASSFPVAQAVRLAPVLALLVVGVIPRLSLSVGGLASADYRVRHVGRLDLNALRARYRASNAILVGALLGVAVVVVWGGLSLDLAGGRWDRPLALSLAAAAVLRARVFSRTQHMLPLRIAGVVVAVGGLLRYGYEEPSLTSSLVLFLAVASAAGIALASMPMSEITRARVKRTLNLVEFLVVVDLLVVLCGAMGVFEKLGGLI